MAHDRANLRRGFPVQVERAPQAPASSIAEKRDFVVTCVIPDAKLPIPLGSGKHRLHDFAPQALGMAYFTNAAKMTLTSNSATQWMSTLSAPANDSPIQPTKVPVTRKSGDEKSRVWSVFDKVGESLRIPPATRIGKSKFILKLETPNAAPGKQHGQDGGTCLRGCAFRQEALEEGPDRETK